MVFNIDVANTTIKNLVKFWYEETLNGIRTFEVFTDGNDATLRLELDTEETIEIYKDGFLAFKGEVEETGNFSGGGIVLTGFGQEAELSDEKVPLDSGKKSKVWLSTSANTIFSDLVTSVPGWLVDVSGSTSIVLDSFRVTENMSVWNGVIKLLKATNKDIDIDDSTKTLILVDNKGASGNAAFNEGTNCGNVSWNKKKPEASKVVVFGKGDGENQITGSAGSGTPVKEIIDRNIISTSEANNRATKELSLIQQSIKTYNFIPYSPNENIEIGDTVSLNSYSAGLDNVDVDVVRLIRGIEAETEFIKVFVTNPEYRIAKSNLAEQVASDESRNQLYGSSMQGSGNTLTWARGINAKLGSSLKIPFYVPSDFVEDETGEIRINSFTVDYDIDPFRSNIGTAVTDSHLHDLSPGSTAAHKHDPSDTGHPHSNANQTSTTITLAESNGSTSWSENIATSWDTIVNNSLNGTYDFVYVELEIEEDGWSGTDTIGIRIQLGSTVIIQDIEKPFNTSHSPLRLCYVVPIFASTTATLSISMYSDNNNDYQGYAEIYVNDKDHSHTVNSWNTQNGTAAVDDNNRTPSLSGDSNNTAANVTIGDDVSDAASVNATEVDIYLDYWNGSSWVNKYSILNTGTTLDEDVDLTDGGTWPDASGWWRVRVEPDNSSPDYAQAIVKIKHNLDN